MPTDERRGAGPLAEAVAAFMRTIPLAKVERIPARRFESDSIVDVETRDLFQRNDRIYVSETSRPRFTVLKGVFDQLHPRPVALVLPDSEDLVDEPTLNHFQTHLKLDFLGTFSQFLDRRLNSDVIADTLRSRPDLVEAMRRYVPQHTRDETGHQLPQESLSLVERWEKDPDSRLLVLLADAGHGKTMLTKTLAHRLATRYFRGTQRRSPSPVPLLIAFGPELAGRFTTFEGLVAQHFTSMRLPLPALPTLRFLINRRRVIFILDGLDELLEADFAKAQDNLREFLSMAGPDAKVILTSRKAFFRTSDAVERELMQPVGVQDVKLYELQPFDDAQIEIFVAKFDKRQRAGLERVLAHPETRELARTPHVLASLAEVAPFVDDRQVGGSTFDLLFPAIAQREQENQKHTIPADLQMAFLLRLAREMLVTGDAGFPGGSVAVIAAEAADNMREYAGSVPAEELSLLENHYCLTATNDGTLVFQAQYWREYFLGRALSALASEPGAGLDAVFHRTQIAEGVLRNAAASWSESLQERCLRMIGGGTSTRNVLALLGYASSLGHTQKDIVADLVPSISLNAINFHGTSIESLDLRGLEFKGCDLVGASFVDCALDGADFGGSIFEGTSFIRSSLTGANFARAELASLAVNGHEAAGRLELEQVLATAGATSPWQAGVPVDVGTETRLIHNALDYGTAVLRKALYQYWAADARSFIKQRVLVINFSKGFDPADKEFLLRRLFPEVRRGGYLAEQSFGGHEPVVAVLPGRKDELSRFMRDGDLSEDLRAAVLRSLGMTEG